jgi:hypothetical protein
MICKTVTPAQYLANVMAQFASTDVSHLSHRVDAPSMSADVNIDIVATPVTLPGAPVWSSAPTHCWRRREMRVPNSLWLDLVAQANDPVLKAVFAIPHHCTLEKNTKTGLYFVVDVNDIQLHVSVTNAVFLQTDFSSDPDCDTVALISAASGYRNLYGMPMPMFD